MLHATLGLSFAVFATTAVDLYVDGSAPGCAGGTGTQADPLCSITSALEDAAPGETIFIAPGVYTESLLLDQSQQLIGIGGQAVTILDGAGSNQIIYISGDSDVLIEGLTLRNGFHFRGAGIEARSESRVTLRDSTIESCSSPGFEQKGGGIFGYNADIILENSTLSNNDAHAGGGVALLYHSDLRAYDSRLTGNTATRYGGAAYVDRSQAHFVRSTLDDNWGAIGGAVYGWVASSIVIKECSLLGNYGYGSAVGGNHTCTIENSTLSGNDGFHVINVFSGVVTLRNATVTDNDSVGVYDPFPGAIHGGTINLKDSIVAGNQGGDFGDPVTSQGNNLIGTGAVGVAHGVNGDHTGTPGIPLDPMLAPLADNGGPTLTHGLLPGSRALDAGSNVGLIPVADQRGAVRPWGASTDIGAFEAGSDPDGLCAGNVQSCSLCPCGNDAPSSARGGCLNSAGSSAHLVRTFTGSVATGDLRFEGRELPAGAFAVLLSGDALAPTNPANPCFGTNSGIQSVLLDGKRCIVQGIQRHGGRVTAGDGTIGDSTPGWGPPDNPFLGIATQAGFTAGTTRFFQATYRDFDTAVCMTGLNTTQASEVTFTP